MTSFKAVEDHGQQINKTHLILAKIKAKVLNLQFVTRWE